MIDFRNSPVVERLCDDVRTFVEEVCRPAEAADTEPHGPSDELRRQLQEAARRAGVFAPQVDCCLGGHGITLVAQCAVLEAAGRSLLGPLALNAMAPDEGNMHLLSHVGDPQQRERYLVPLAAGDTRSCFAMTEPPPGAGSDPGMLQTTAVRVDGGWSITGRKWYITGADGAAFAICMARTDEQIRRGRGATMFLVEADNPGMRMVRLMDTIDRCFVGGHAELSFDDCLVPDSAVLGEVGKGYDYAQVRLGPARLTHCMRWTGLAAEALDVTSRHVNEREAFGMPLGRHGKVIDDIASCLTDLESARLLTLRAAWALQVGARDGLSRSSMAKSYVGEVCHRVIDRCVQVLGGLGVSHDGPVARYAQEVRPFRVYDGPTEVHRWSIGRRHLRDVAARAAAGAAPPGPSPAGPAPRRGARPAGREIAPPVS